MNRVSKKARQDKEKKRREEDKQQQGVCSEQEEDYSEAEGSSLMREAAEIYERLHTGNEEDIVSASPV